MKAAIYCRVSTEDQEREGTSLQTQLEACLNYCRSKGYDVASRFSETHSGLVLDRPMLSQLRELVRNEQIDVVVIHSLDRLSRDPTHGVILTQELDKHSASLEAVTEDVDNSDLGKLINYIRHFAAKLEAEKIRERTIRGKRERVKAGRLPGGRFSKLYGYNYLAGRGMGEGKRYVNEEETKVVRDIYRMYIEDGLSLCKITERLNALGIPAPSGRNPWNRTGVYYILTNLAYTGRTYLFTRYKTEAKRHLTPFPKHKLTHVVMRPREEWLEAEGATPAIISEELFNQVQQRLKRNKGLSLRNARREYLLSGYIFCEACGRRYLARKSSDTRAYYRCPRCKGKGLNADKIELAAWHKIEEALSSPETVLAGIELLRNEQGSENRYEGELGGIDSTLRHLEREKDRAWKAFILTGDEEKFTSEIKGITSRINEFTERKVDLESKLEQIKHAETDVEAIKQHCETVCQGMGTLSFSDKRNTLEALRIRVIVNEEEITLRGTLPIVSSQCA